MISWHLGKWFCFLCDGISSLFISRIYVWQNTGHMNCVSGVVADLTHFILETPKGVLAKSADQDQMPHNVASDLGLPCLASCSAIFQQKYLN